MRPASHSSVRVAPEEGPGLGPPVQRARLQLPMRDGTLLATDVYWAAGVPLEDSDPRPVLLERSPYDVRAVRFSDGRHADGTQASPKSGAAFFVAAGYIVVRQDCRGRGASEGVFVKYVNEPEDGFDTHAWLAAQPWCDGRVVTQGVSYGAHTQTAAASVRSRPMTAMIVDSGGFSSAFDAGGRFGGAFELKQAVWAYRRALGDGDLSGEARSVLEAWFDSLPWRPGVSPLSAYPEFEDFLFEQWSHESLDEFWTQPGLYARGHYGDFPGAPMLFLGSWYDPYVLAAVENFEAVGHHPSSALVLGPWTHGARSLTHAGEVDFGAGSALDGSLATDYLTFKRDWLADALEGVPLAEPVTYFLMGGGSGRRNAAGRLEHGGQWRTSTTWPPTGGRTVDLYLHGDLTLAEARPPTESVICYEADPHHPVPSRGGGITSGEPLMSGGAFDQTYLRVTARGSARLPLSSRHDVVSFQTPPLTEALVVAGKATLHLALSSDARDTDVAVKLVDVYPPSADYPEGFAMNITDGMLRCRFRDDPAKPHLMTPGEVYRIEVGMPDTANLFARGHRLRLDVSSSNFPRCDVNPNTGGSVVGARTFVTARNVLHLGASRLTLDICD
jgi:uncharacterized protein